MKRVFEWIGGFALIAFSFYFTDKVSMLIASKSELMEEIRLVSKNYEVNAEDAVIDIKDNTIIPGKNGRVVDENESYLNMNGFGIFNENYLVYKYVKPNISLEDNKDKFIKKGNNSLRRISIVINNNVPIQNYFDDKNIKYNRILSNVDDFKNNKAEYINGGNKQKEFKNIHNKIFNKPHICINNYSDINSCIKYKYYIVKPELVLAQNNLIEVMNHVSSGSIILITDNCKLESIQALINTIKYKDLDIVYLSDLIVE